MYFKNRYFIVVILVFTLIFSWGCTSKETASQTITIAEQYGLAYAPIQIMKAHKLLEKNLPEVQINWTKLVNTAAIRESMLAGDVDIGFMAIPPFLIGWDKGMEWKIATGVCSSPVGLVSNDPEISTLSDISIEDRIALPQPGSIQHMLLSMACEKEFGDAQKFDNLLISMSHPDGMNALISNQNITLHFTSPPYLFKELEIDGMKQILDGKDAIGKDFSFIVGVTTNDFHDENADYYKAFIKSFNESIEFINNNPEESAEILSEIFNLSKEETLTYMSQINYNAQVQGISEFSDFMTRNHYINNQFDDFSEILWNDVPYEK